MNRNEDRDFGSKIAYDPQWKGPLEIERKQTNAGFLIFYGIYLVVWIGVGIYAFCSADLSKFSVNGEIENDLSISQSDQLHILYATVGFTIFGIILSVVYLLFLRYFPKATVAIGIFVLLLSLLLTFIVGVYAISKDPKENISATVQVSVTGVFIIIIVMMIVAFRKKLAIACRVIQESTKAVIFFPSTFLFPILPFILIVISLTYTVSVSTCLTLNPSSHRNDTEGRFRVLHGINAFGMVWTINFICAFSQMVLTGTFATWYWILDKDRIPNNTILKFLYITTRYHLGTLAFGSLIITVVEFSKNALRNQSQNSSGGSAGLLECFAYMCECLKNFLEWISRNAYIMCILHGTEFIQSAKDAFNLIMRNIMSVVAIKTATTAILILGQLFVIGLSSLTTYAYFRNFEINVWCTAVVLVAISTLIITLVVFKVLSTAIDTIFLCVLEDYERNDGSSARPYFMSAKLKELLIKSA